MAAAMAAAGVGWGGVGRKRDTGSECTEGWDSGSSGLQGALARQVLTGQKYSGWGRALYANKSGKPQQLRPLSAQSAGHPPGPPGPPGSPE